MTKLRRAQLRYMFFGKRFRRWAFYFLLFFLLMMTIKDVTDLVRQYVDNPKEANMNIVFNETIMFPKMTFCVSKIQAWSHFQVGNSTIDTDPEWDHIIEESLTNMTTRESFLKSSWDYRLVVKAYQAIATVNSLERESTPKSARRDIIAFAKSKKFTGIRKLVKDWHDIIKARNVTFTEFQQKVGIETLRRSLRAFTRLSYEEEDQVDASVKITWISLLYICFQPVLGINKTFEPIKEQGEFFRMTLIHNPENIEARKSWITNTESEECMTLDFHGRPTTLARNMEGKGRVRDGITEELCISKIHEVKVDVRASYVMLPNNEKSTACRNYDDGDENEFDCRSRCRMEMLQTFEASAIFERFQQMCLCTGLTLQYLADNDDLSTFPPCDYEQCGIRAQQNFTDKLCADKCLPDCVQMRYNVLVDQKGRSKRADLTMVTLIWGSFEYLKLEQQYIWNAATFIAALGGSIGMWLGLSVLSLIQFVTYLASRVTKTVKSKFDNNYDEDDGDEDANPFGGPVATNPFDSPFRGENTNKKVSVAAQKPAVASAS